MTKKLKRPLAFLSAMVMVMAMLLYFPSGTFSSLDWGLKASAEEITPSQPTKGDGSEGNPYQIGTAAELYWFAGLVNGTLPDSTAQNQAACAVLTADITVNEGVLSGGELNTENESTFRSWTPIGYWDLDTKVQYPFSGIFDGAGNKNQRIVFQR